MDRSLRCVTASASAPSTTVSSTVALRSLPIIEALMQAVGGRLEPLSAGISPRSLRSGHPTGDLSPFNGDSPGGTRWRADDPEQQDRDRMNAGRRGHPGRYQSRDIASLESALRQSVEVRLRSTGRVACLLSGGIDSTVIGALAAESGQRFGMGLFLDGDETVRTRQEMVAEALGMELSQLRLTPVRGHARLRRLRLHASSSAGASGSDRNDGAGSIRQEAGIPCGHLR